MNEFYSLKNILKNTDCKYYMIFGERSNGKTYATLAHGLEQFVKYGQEIAYIRRMEEDFKGQASTLFANHEDTGLISKLTKGKWTSTAYWSGKWYLARYEDDKLIKDETPFCYAFALSKADHYKSSSYPHVTTIIFDEFLSRSIYLTDEFLLFTSILSTIIRNRDNVKVFMLGNTVNKYCPYFAEMGLRHILEMKPGDIDLYTFGEGNLRIAVEYTLPTAHGKKSDSYFCFDNPKLKMITTGAWEIGTYPHCPMKIKPKDILFSFFIKFDNNLLQGDVIDSDNTRFIFFHRKTTPIKDEDRDLIYSPDFDNRTNHRRKLTKPCYPVEQKIVAIFRAEQVYYQDNDCGEIVRNYLQWCRSDTL